MKGKKETPKEDDEADTAECELAAENNRVEDGVERIEDDEETVAEEDTREVKE